MPPSRLPLNTYVDGILSGDRFVLSQAITLVESQRAEDQQLAQRIVQKVLPSSQRSLRIGITGVPGVGKSTFIEALGGFLNARQLSLAVLTVDPSSPRTKGSILGDKTRMATLAQSPLAYIRPSATGSTLGGVAQQSRETLLLCEAAGYNIIVVETVGVGQSETEVHHITDFFLLLMLAGAGDELQGIKKGIMELADAIVINKADGHNRALAQQAQQDYKNALHLFRAPDSGVLPQVLTCSALQREGIDKIWKFIEHYCEETQRSGFFQKKRQAQNLRWMHRLVHYHLDQQLHHPRFDDRRQAIEQQVSQGVMSAQQGANALITLYQTRHDA